MTDTAALFRWLFLEEWRLHARLFGGRRFAVVPLVLLVGSALAFRLLLLADVTPALLVAGLHVLVVLLGLQVGAVALVGRDMIENLLGETTLLLTSVRTLPVGDRLLLALFILKDVIYYGVLYVAPVTLGLAALVGSGLTVTDVGTALVTILASFAVGVAASLTLVALSSLSRVLDLGLVAVVATIVYLYPDTVIRYSPYAVYTDASPIAAVTTLAFIFGVGGFGFGALDLSRPSRTRTTPNQYHWLRHHLPGPTPWLVAKAILDVRRSAGGLAKIVVSLGLVVGVVGAVLEGVTRAVGLRPAAGPAFAGLLALASFTTYNWLTTVDDSDVRRALPVPLSSVFWSVLLAHLILAVPVATALLLVAGWWFGPTGLLPGVLALPGLIVYVVGVTAYITGLNPGERLFDAGRFATFSLAAAVVAVPVLVAAFVTPTTSFPLAWVVTLASFGAGALGLGLVHRAGPRWTRVRRRTGDG